MFIGIAAKFAPVDLMPVERDFGGQVHGRKSQNLPRLQ
jgi:hypothetical protein